MKPPVYELTLEEAIELYRNWRLSFFPLVHGEKRPLAKLLPEGSWKPYQERHPTEEEVNRWLEHAKREPINLAIVCGKVSEGLVVIDFESEEAFKDFIGKVERLEGDLKYAISNTWIVKTGRGYHVYLKLPYGPEVRTKPKLREGVDVKGEGGYVVAPPSLHPSGATYTFIINDPKNTIPQPISEADWIRLLKILSGEEAALKVAPTGRRLDESLILRIVEALRPAYREGFRDLIVFYLAGWLRKAGVDHESARKVVELLAEGDEERESRLYVVDRTYGLRGHPPSEEEMKGKTGLQEVLEEAVGEGKALEILRFLEEALGVSSPYRDAVFEILDYDKQLYALANLRKGLMVTARRTESGFKYKDRVAAVAPVEVIVYEDPLGGGRKFKVRYEGETLQRGLLVGPAKIHDHIVTLKAEGLVERAKLIEDVLTAILNAFIKKGRAKVVHEIDKPGFFYIDGEIKLLNHEFKSYGREEKVAALQLLDELAYWYGFESEERCVVDRYVAVLKWGVKAPFHYAFKQMKPGRWLPNIYLHGPTGVSKTTLGKIVLKMWGLPELRFTKGGSSIDTVPRLGEVLSQTTFPILIIEPHGAFRNEDVREVIKSATESLVARGRFYHGVYQEIPALAPLIVTSNKPLPPDDALRRRFDPILRFYRSEQVPREVAMRFENKVLPRLDLLAPIGPMVWELVREDYSLIEKPLEILELLYESVKMKPPAWIYIDYKPPSEEELEEMLIEDVRAYMVSAVNEASTKHIKRIFVDRDVKEASEATLEDRVKAVAVNNFLPWLYYKGGRYIITAALIEELRRKNIEVDSLKSLADIMKWRYDTVKIGGRPVRGIIVDEEDFHNFLSSRVEEMEH